MKSSFFVTLVLASLGFGSLQAQTSTPSGALILTPPSEKPRINGPKVFGVRPGAPFLYAIPATGKRPVTFAAEGLPKGLTLDSATGLISGKLTQPGAQSVVLRASNALGSTEKSFRIIVGDKIALTPPMGWNSWNCWGGAVSQEKVLSSARAMVAKGLRDHGWTYINIDDGWQGMRGGPQNAIQPNAKFPDMKALGDAIHAMGLKFGIYSTPWIISYEGHVGGYSDNQDGTYEWIKEGDYNEICRISKDPAQWDAKRKANRKHGTYSFVDKDVPQWAAWGVDYLKYDWIPNDVPHVKEMSEALRKSGRDILYSLSNNAPYGNAPEIAHYANAWRTTVDIQDKWDSVSKIGFSQDRWVGYAGPGHWNDPDMLVVGHVGWGSNLHPAKLTPNEQYTEVSLWCLLSAPLLIGCDLAQVDDFTLGLLTNDEVLDIDQDPLGRQAVQVRNEGNRVFYAKPLEDGSVAVGLFNLGETEQTVTALFLDLPVPQGKLLVRDLWRQKDLGVFEGKFETSVAAHGVVLVRLIPQK
jgi:alpha-galactosidase